MEVWGWTMSSSQRTKILQDVRARVPLLKECLTRGARCASVLLFLVCVITASAETSVITQSDEDYIVGVAGFEQIESDVPLLLWDGQEQSTFTTAYLVTVQVRPVFFTLTTGLTTLPQLYMDQTPITVVDLNPRESTVTGYVPRLPQNGELWYARMESGLPLTELDPVTAFGEYAARGLNPLQVDIGALLTVTRKIASVTARRTTRTDPDTSQTQEVFEVILTVENFTEATFWAASTLLDPQPQPPDVVVGDLASDEVAYSHDDQTITAVFLERPADGADVRLQYLGYSILAPEPFVLEQDP